LSNQEGRFERNPDYVFRRIVDEAVLVPIHQEVADMDSLYTMNPVGAFVWEQLDGGATQTELLAAILDEYDAEPEVAAADLDAFMKEMVAVGAIREV
jgi:hypothetical protein